jgi:hypothetical protein
MAVRACDVVVSCACFLLHVFVTAPPGWGRSDHIPFLCTQHHDCTRGPISEQEAAHANPLK